MNSRTIQNLALAALICVAPASLADTYTPIDFPGADSTEVAGINASGVMVGSYTDSSGSTHGFKLDGDAFTALDFPGALTTFAFSVNARGDVAGAFLDATNQWHGYVLANGDFFVQDYPGATTGTFSFGIGVNGTLVGWARWAPRKTSRVLAIDPLTRIVTRIVGLHSALKSTPSRWP